MKTILVSIDFSPVSRAVVDQAADLAGPAGAELVILHVVQPPAIVTDFDPAVSIVEVMRSSAARALSKWKRSVEARGLGVSTVCLTGPQAAPLIAEEAVRRSAIYVVIGSHGHAAFYDLLVGSTTAAVLRRVACPVVIVPSLKVARASSPSRIEVIRPSGLLDGPTPAVPNQSSIPGACRKASQTPFPGTGIPQPHYASST